MNDLTHDYLLSGEFPYGLAEVEVLSYEERKKLLVRHLKRYSIRRGDFTLKSGKKSSWFIDSKITACHPQGMIIVASMIVDHLAPEINAIGGLTMGADPVSFITAAIANVRGRPTFTYSVRKEIKDHGAGGQIAGLLPVGALCAITEDTVSRGTSMLAAYSATIAAGGQVLLATAIVDRGGTVTSLMRQYEVDFVPLVTAPELGFDYEGGEI